MRERNADLDGRSISVLDLGGVDNQPTYARIARDLGIVWAALSDEDVQDDGTIKPRTLAARGELARLAGPEDLITFWPGSLEAALDQPARPKMTPWRQEELVDGLSTQELAVAHPRYAQTLESLHQWVLKRAPQEPAKATATPAVPRATNAR